MGSTRGRTRTLESARRVAFIWKQLGDDQEAVRIEAGELAKELDKLLEAAQGGDAEPEEHRTTVRTITSRGRAENGYQPEKEYVWSCSCRPGKQSGDMGGSGWVKQAADKHRADPTQFPGWLE